MKYGNGHSVHWHSKANKKLCLACNLEPTQREGLCKDCSKERQNNPIVFLLTLLEREPCVEHLLDCLGDHWLTTLRRVDRLIDDYLFVKNLSVQERKNSRLEVAYKYIELAKATITEVRDLEDRLHQHGLADPHEPGREPWPPNSSHNWRIARNGRGRADYFLTRDELESAKKQSDKLTEVIGDLDDLLEAKLNLSEPEEGDRLPDTW